MLLGGQRDGALRSQMGRSQVLSIFFVIRQELKGRGFSLGLSYLGTVRVSPLPVSLPFTVCVLVGPQLCWWLVCPTFGVGNTHSWCLLIFFSWVTWADLQCHCPQSSLFLHLPVVFLFLCHIPVFEDPKVRLNHLGGGGVRSYCSLWKFAVNIWSTLR